MWRSHFDLSIAHGMKLWGGRPRPRPAPWPAFARQPQAGSGELWYPSRPLRSRPTTWSKAKAPGPVNTSATGAADALRDAYVDKRLPVKALERLVELMTLERDELVLINIFELLASDAREQSISLTYVALSHPAPEVRRRACEQLAAHPDRRHVAALTASLDDPSPAVVESAVKALDELARLTIPSVWSGCWLMKIICCGLRWLRPWLAPALNRELQHWND